MMRLLYAALIIHCVDCSVAERPIEGEGFNAKQIRNVCIQQECSGVAAF
jgi:hypothetical protein